MLNFILIGFCLGSGFLIQKYKGLPEDSFKSVNAWIINIALPAVALKYIPKIDWEYSLILPFLMPLLVWTGSYFFVRLLRKFIQMDRNTQAALLLTSGLGNTGFLGFPLSKAYYGEEGLQIAILCDQACFLIVATLAILTGAKASSGGSFNAKFILKKVFLFPPFIAFCLAFLLPLFISLEPMEPLLSALAVTLIPLALFSVGFQLELRAWRSDSKLIGLALSYKLVLAPLLVLIVCLSFGLTNFIAKVSIFEAAMAPMVTGAIIAVDYNLNPKLANLILGIGIPVSFLSTFLWFLLLGSF